MKKFKKFFALSLALVLGTTVLAGCANGDESSKEKKGKVTIGYVNWADDVAMTELAKVILEDKMGYEVETTMADAGVIFTSLADGNTDFFLDLWLPVTHRDYLEQYGDDLVKLGESYNNAKIGTVVPSYVDIDSIDELNSVKDKFDGRIIGIDAGAGVMQATEKAIEEYGLDYDLTTGSGPVMTAALSDAIDNKEWIAVTGWEPHWKFSKWDLKFLEDPKNVYGDTETAFVVARKGTKEDMPEVHEFMENFYLELDEIADLMQTIEEGSNIEEDVRSWVAENEDIVDKWIPTK